MQSVSAGLLDSAGWSRAVALAAGVIERARRRQRRRRARFAVLALAVTAVGVIAYVLTSAQGVGGPVLARGGDSAFVAPGSVLDPGQPPYMGVSCPWSNSIACDRVGLAIWLRHSAISITATIAGQPLTLHRLRVDALSAAPGPRKAFIGYLQPAGIVNRLHVKPGPNSTWYGSTFPPPPLVKLRIHYGNGKVVTTQLHVGLNPGWG